MKSEGPHFTLLVPFNKEFPDTRGALSGPCLVEVDARPLKDLRPGSFAGKVRQGVCCVRP